MYYHICPDCGANLDPGEKCDCKKEKALQNARQMTTSLVIKCIKINVNNKTI